MIFYKLTINRIILLVYIIAIVYFATAILTNDPIKLWLSVIIGTATYCYLIVTLWRRNKLTPVKGHCQLTMFDDKLECNFDNGKQQSMLWKDVNKITIRRIESKDSQVSNQIWLRFHSFPWRRKVTIPIDANGFQPLVERLSSWENFNIRKLEKAQETLKPLKVTIWERKDFS
jgi:hypothetical protein